MIPDDITFEEIKKKYPDATLKNINEYINMIFEQANCKACKGLDCCQNSNVGMVLDCKNDSFYFKECKYKTQNNLKIHSKSKIVNLFLPDNVLNATLFDYDQNCESRRKIIAHVNKLMANYDSCEKRKGLVLCGQFSIGKTYTLSVIANMLADNNISSMLVYFPDFVGSLKNNIGDSNFERIMSNIRDCDALLLDDLGAENLTPWVRDEILGPIINYRLMENKPLFISTNLNSMADIKEYLAIDKSKQGQLKANRIYARLDDLVYFVDMSDSKRYSR